MEEYIMKEGIHYVGYLVRQLVDMMDVMRKDFG
jgi:hypothetical protein